MIPEWVGTVDVHGVLHLEAAKGFQAWLKVTFANQPVRLVIRKLRPKASRKQHGFWRGCVVPMVAEYMGYLPHEYDAVHDALMRELCGLKEDADPRLQIRKSSADYDTAEFNEWLIEQVQIWAATKLGLVIPDPDPLWKSRKKAA